MKMHESFIVVAATLASLVSTSSPAQSPKPVYHIAETYKLGSTGRWDYLTFDAASKSLYIAQGRQVMVFDTAAGKVVGIISGLGRAHDIVLSKDGKTGYISDGDAGIVQVFERPSLKKLGTIAVGANPDGMLIEPITGHLFVFNGKSKDLYVVDLATQKTLAKLALPGKPEFPTTDGQGHVFVNIEDTHQVVKIDAATNKVMATWTLAGCESPTGMAIDASAGRIFPVCDNAKMPVVDTATGKIITTASIGTGPDAVVYDAQRHLLFSSNGDAGTLSIVRQVSKDSYTPIQTLKTAKNGRTLALSSESGDIYVLAPDPASAKPMYENPFVLYRITK